MTLADVFVRFERAELPFLQLSADVADGFPSLRIFGQLHEQVIRKLIAALVGVNVRHNNFGCASLIECSHKFYCVALSFEPT